MFELDGRTLRSEELDRYVPESRSYEPFALELPKSLPEGGLSALIEEVLESEALHGHLSELARNHSPDFYGAHNWGSPVQFESRQYSELLEISDKAWERWASEEYRQGCAAVAGGVVPPFRQELDWSLREWFDQNCGSRDALSVATWRAMQEEWPSALPGAFGSAAAKLWGVSKAAATEAFHAALGDALQIEMENVDTDGPLDLLDTCEYGLLYAPPGSSEPCGLTRDRFDWGTFVSPSAELAATLTFLRISREEFVTAIAAWHASPDAHARVSATYASLSVDSEAFAGEPLLSAEQLVELLNDALAGSSMLQPVVAVRAKFGPLLARDRSETAPALVVSGQKLLVLHDFSNGAGGETSLAVQAEISPRVGTWYVDEGRRHGIQAVYDLTTSSWRGNLVQMTTITAADLAAVPSRPLLPSAVRLAPAVLSRFCHRGIGEAAAVALAAAGMLSHAASLRSAVARSESWQQTLRLCSEHGVALSAP